MTNLSAATRPSRGAMRARAALATTRSPRPGRPGRTRIETLRSQAPLVLRPTRLTDPVPWLGARSDVARVALAAGAAGPVGGDELILHVTVGAGSALVLSEVSASLLLPGVHGDRSTFTTSIRVGEGATLIWLPQPLIAARGCRHLNDVRIDLDDGARLLVREEILLGRHGESPGTLHQRVQVRLSGKALYRQDLSFGPESPGWDSPAVTGQNRAVGSLLVVDPSWAAGAPQAHAAPAAHVLAGDAAVLPLAGPAALISAVGAASLDVRRSLSTGFAALEECFQS